MDYFFILLLYGFLAAVIGVSLPGLLNMTAVKIAHTQGQKAVVSYLSGALIVIFLQAYIAIFFAKLIESSDFITEILHEIGLVIFLLLTIFFFFFAKPMRIGNEEGFSSLDEVKPKKHPFLYGLFLALINVFSIPYYVFLSVTLATYDLPIFEWMYTLIFSIGVVLGSLLLFCIYVKVFKKVAQKNNFITLNINKIIGTITGIISIITLFKLLK